ncbi:MAG: hypothetical protein ABI670_15285 [Chloroflexota bacterium]
MTTTDFTRYDPEVPLYCANHPDTETFLRCGKCEKPICARCRVSTPVGFRCYDCANMQVLPTYAVGTDVYIRAGVAGLLAAAIMGALMGLFPAFEFWAALIMGIVVPEAVTAATNQKRGQGLRIIAMGSIVFGFILSRVVMQAFPLLITLGGINRPAAGGISFLDHLPIYVTQYTILWLVMALVLAYQRLR